MENRVIADCFHSIQKVLGANRNLWENSVRKLLYIACLVKLTLFFEPLFDSMRFVLEQ